jgi:antitoxin (DNA-binding transcriptional repressor) of toxin-antitoxin stability system
MRQGEEIVITKRGRVVARLVPEPQISCRMPDFLKRLRVIYGKKALKVVGAELVAQDRSRY